VVLKPVLLTLILGLGFTAPVVAAAFAFRRPSLVFVFLVAGGAALWLVPPWTEVTTFTIAGNQIVSERRFGHSAEVVPTPDRDKGGPVQKTYEISWPQVWAESAILVAGLTLVYVLLRSMIERTQPSAPQQRVGPS
jgi:hypothetical protein